MNMSDAPHHFATAALGTTTGFKPDTRFAAAEDNVQPPSEPGLPAPSLAPEPEDPVALAYTAGFTAGAAKADAEASERARIETEACEALALSFARLDREMVKQLEIRLRETVAALCETALAPLALDKAALLPRIERAAGMLARIDDDRVIRLHPEDLAFVSPQLCSDWKVKPDASLARGAIRVEGKNGGVEDNPEHWARTISEALAQC